MNGAPGAELARVAREIGLMEPRREHARHAFALACVLRIEHLLEHPEAIAAVPVLRGHVAGEVDAATLATTAARVREVARSHRGSHSIDGSQHAAVSATNALANALEGRALEAASYAAYATVYAYGGYAVTDASAFAPEIDWQLRELRRLAAS